MQETASWVSLLFNSAIKRTMYRTTLSFFAVNYKVFRFNLFYMLSIMKLLGSDCLQKSES